MTLRNIGGFEEAELSAYDGLMRSRPDEGMDDRLLVVGISEADIQRRGEYPIHDGTLAEVLQRLQDYEPRVIGLDIARDVPQGDGRQSLLQTLEQGDRIIAACQLSGGDSPGLPPPPGVPKERTGFADLPEDANGLIRRTILVSTPGEVDDPLPSSHLCNTADLENQLVSLAFLLALRYLEPEGIRPEETEQGQIQLGSAVFKPLGSQASGYHDLDSADYQVLLNYRRAETPLRIINLTDVLDGRVKPEWVNDKVILIGYTSDVAKDIFYTPISQGRNGVEALPGVVIHAHAVSQLVSAALGERSLLWYWSDPIEGIWILAWAIAGGTVAWFARKIWWFIPAEALAIALLYGTCLWIFGQGGWVPLVPAAIALLATAVGVTVLDRAHKGGYTQAVYEQVRDQVKGVLKPEIEIDQEKVSQQVAEITETSYFQELRQRAKEIREKRTQGETGGSTRDQTPPK